MSFNRIWSFIQDNIKKGQIIKNWTKDSGYIGDPFTINCLDTNRIDITPLRAESIQRIPKKDFESVYDIWEQYLSGNFQRSKIREFTRFSKYIISIFHLVNQSNKILL